MHNNSYSPGTFGCHEALDRSSMLLEMMDDLARHPAVALNPDFRRQADSIVTALGALYSAIGERHLQGPSLPEVRCRRMPSGEGLPLPSYAHEGDSGLDLAAAIDVILPPGGRMAVPTGFALSIPQGFEGQIRPRSGLARDKGVTVLNSPGTIDSSYRGEVKVLLVNLGLLTATVARGDRIAQLVIAPVARAAVVEVDELADTARGAGGFGSSGI